MLYSNHIIPAALPAVPSRLRYSLWILTGLMKTVLPVPSLYPCSLFSPLLLPLRDFLLVEARIRLIFLTFVSGFDSETSGSMFVQFPGSSLLTIWLSCHLLLCFHITLLMLRLPLPIFKKWRLTVIQPFCVTVSSSWF